MVAEGDLVASVFTMTRALRSQVGDEKVVVTEAWICFISRAGESDGSMPTSTG
jgi:hypothetical protein